MNDQHTPPHDSAAERAVLAACMNRPDLIDNIHLSGSDFYRPAHETIWESIQKLHKARVGADWVAVKADLELRKLKDGRNELTLVGGWEYLHELVSGLQTAENVDYYAAIVRNRSARRRLIAEHTRGLQEAYGSEDPIEALLARTEARLKQIPTAEPDYTGSLMSFDEFCDQPVPEADWIIPGLLNRGDRLILTGFEGLGKTVLQRQIAVCAAAGVHPFTFRPIPPMTVLFVDAENPKSIMIKSFRNLRESVRRNRGPMDEKRLWIERVPAGLDLAKPQDRLWLQRLVSLVNPDLLCIGPAYKLYVGGSQSKDEDLARQVTSALDSIRESVGCALILEHHAGHGNGMAKTRDVRPFGSSLWLRWPEFGFGIAPAEGFTRENRLVDFTSWRGPRDERDWPGQLQAATNFMPWIDATHA